LGAKKQQAYRVVLDTNALVSALLFTGRASALVGRWKDGLIIPLVSRDTLEELVRVLAYPKFRLSTDEIKAIINQDVLPYVETVRITKKVRVIEADPADNAFLECAVSGKADFIITGDAHLLGLGEFEGTPIVKIADFANRALT
jgi:putative PIN family toxin of toxin-antitoxin system